MLSRNSRDLGWGASRSNSSLSIGTSDFVIDSSVFPDTGSVWVTVDKYTGLIDEESYIHVDAGTSGEITIAPEGDATDIDLIINAKGSGRVIVNGAVMNVPLEIDLSGTASGGAYGLIGAVSLGGNYSKMVVEVANGGVNNLSNFKIQRQAHGDAEWIDWLEGTDFQSVTETLEETGYEAPNYVNTLPSGSALQIKVDVVAAYAVRFSAYGDGGTASITIKGYAA